MPARRRRHLLQMRRQQAQPGCGCDQAAAQQHQVVVVGGDALEPPQQPRIGLLPEVGRRQLHRRQPLHVPGVEIFVADQAQQAQIAGVVAGGAGARQLAAPRQQRRAGAVLQAALAFVGGAQQKDVALERRPAAPMPESDLGPAQACRVGEQPRAVETGPGAGNDHFMRHAGHVEGAAPERAEFERVVDQFGIVGGLETLAHAAAVHRGGHVPARRQPAQAQALGLHRAALGGQEQAGAVEKSARLVEPGTAHRRVERMHPPAQLERGVTLAMRDPARLVELINAHRPTALRALQILQMAGEFAQQIAAGQPHRQRQQLPRRRRRQAQ
jgi:hypothetical protein